MKEIEKTKEIEKIEKMIKDVYEETFCILSKIYKHQNENRIDECKLNSRLIIPLYRNKDKNKNNFRLSEQELRFVFVERLNRNEYFIENNLFYSIETPTKRPYYLKNMEVDKGRSGCIDLVIFNSCGKRVALIEFKALNPNPANYQKDLLKLKKEPESEIRYFIQILKSYNEKTENSINEKVLKDKTAASGDVKIHYICYSIEKEDYVFREEL